MESENIKVAVRIRPLLEIDSTRDTVVHAEVNAI
jgi:hypothetical protein